MKPTIIKILIRALASVAALLGLSMLFFGLTLHLPSSITSGEGSYIGFSVFSILLGLYFFYIGFLGWFRLSPVAVRHIFSTLAFMLFGTIGGAAHRFQFDDSPEIFPLIALGGGLLLYILYRWAISCCCRHLLLTPLHEVNPQIRNA